MLGDGKKSKNTRVVRAAASSSSDNDDDNVAARVRELEQRRKEKAKINAKKKTTTLLSFDPEDDDNNNEREESSTHKSSKRRSRTSERNNRKRSGLGFGGVETTDDEEEIIPRNEHCGGSQYDLSTLQKLRGEQKIATKRVNADLPAVGLQYTNVNREEASTETIVEEEFISLQSKSDRVKPSHDHSDHPIVLTGDDAMAFAEQEHEDEYDGADFDQHGLFTPSAPPPTSIAKNGNKPATDDNDEMDEGNDQQWEDDVARRAGVLRPNVAMTENNNNGGGGRNNLHLPRRTYGSVSSLKQIRASLEPTITNLETVTSDLETSISRHQSTLSTANDERLTHVISLEKHGTALEYYQGLRVDLATWLGALRELDGMVEKLEEAQHLLEAEITWTKIKRRLEWANDCTEVLEKVGLVKDKLTDGDDGADVVLANVSVLDEFGRNLTSLSSIERIRRWNQRRRCCLHRLQDSLLTDAEDVGNSLKHAAECINDDNINVEESSEWKQRLDAIKQAIVIIPTLVKDDYLSVSNLCSLFFDWQRSYPDDYANCYAEMCIIRMIGVLARLELNEKWDVLNLKDLTSQITEFRWVRSLITLSDSSTETSRCKVIMLEVVQKDVVGRLFDFFMIAKRRGIYDPYSETQTICLTTMVKSIVALFTKYTQDDAIMVGKDMADKVLSALLSLLRYRVGNMLVPIIDSSRNKMTAINGHIYLDGETSDAIAYATIVQAKEICTLVKNILGQWYPIFHHQLQPQQDSIAPLVKFVLVDLVSLRLLPILLSLHDIKYSATDESYSGLSKKLLQDVSCAIQDTGLFAAKEEWIFLSAPLRAAANTILNND